MLKFTQQANEDLVRILAGLMDFRIDDANEPALSLEHAEQIFDDITDHIAVIPQLHFHAPDSFPYMMQFGSYVFTYKRNRTNWYAFYYKLEEDYIVTRITNNWNMIFPRM